MELGNHYYGLYQAEGLEAETGNGAPAEIQWPVEFEPLDFDEED
jgi:hypothetical protein